MHIELTGAQSITADGEIALEAAFSDRTLTILTSSATIREFGLKAIKERASRKLSLGLRAEDSSVRVFMADLL